MNFNPIPFLRTAAKNSPWVVIAIAIHALIIAVLSVIYIAGGREKSNNTATNVSLNTALPPVILPPEVIERKAPPKNADEEVVDYEHEMQYTPTDVAEDLTKEVGENTDDAASNGATGGTAIGAAGPGHYSTGRPSAYATRRAGAGIFGQPRANQGTERAVRDGLLWLVRHQQADGSWNMTALPAICKQGSPPCVAANAKFPEYWGDGLTGLALLAFLGAGFNFDSRQSIVDTIEAKKYHLGEDVIKKGLNYLKNKQLPDGSFGPEQHVYNQALCALALCEAYGLSNPPARYWKDSAQRAIDWLVQAQKINPSGDNTLWGWRYHSRVAVQALRDTCQAQKDELDAKRQPWLAAREELSAKRQNLEEQKSKLKPAEYDVSLKDLQAQAREIDDKLKEIEPELTKASTALAAATNELYDSDLSVTTWVIMAFKSARASGLTVPDDAFEGGKRFVLGTSVSEGLAGYQHSSQAGHDIGGLGDQFQYHVGTMSALSMLCRTFIDHDIDDPFLESAAKQLMKSLPEVSKDKLSIDYYFWYYGSLALNQFDGPESPRKGSRYWDQWNKAMQSSVLATQDQTEKVCTHGGWVIGDRWSLNGGPIYATAINVLTLEVYYRYPNAFGSRLEATTKPK
jgi:hypothetical protein